MGEGKKNIKKTAKKRKKPQKSESYKIEDYSFAGLNDSDKAILKLKIEYPGMKQNEIAKLVKLSIYQVSRIVNKPAFIRAWSDYNTDIMEILKRIKSKAGLRLETIISSTNERVALDAVKLALHNELKPQAFIDFEDEEPDFSTMTTKQKRDYIAKLNARR